MISIASVYLMMTALKPVDEQKDIAMQGFGLFDRVNDSADQVVTVGILDEMVSKMLIKRKS